MLSGAAVVHRAFHCACLLCLLVFARPAFGWVYPEHRDIAVLAVQGLDAERRQALEELWREARAGDEARLCEQLADPLAGTHPTCIDWVALPAMAGDHACSSQQLLDRVRSSDWILEVAVIGARLKQDLAVIPVMATVEQSKPESSIVEGARRRLADRGSRAKRVNAVRDSNSRLMRVDPQMAARAASNNAHFLLSRPSPETDARSYGELTLRTGSELNALGVYNWFHLSALQKASRIAREKLSSDERRALVRSALFDEAFGLHFMEDLHAAGHVAGTWGDAAQRMGTHDFYNANGLEASTWAGRDRFVVLMGDAHMRPQDAELASRAVRSSLEQLVDAATGHARPYELPETPMALATPESLDVCQSMVFPEREKGLEFTERYRAAVVETLMPTPVPGLGPGLGSMPRYRSEVGGFAGLSAAIDGRWIDGGFEGSQDDHGFMAGLNVSFRTGLGLEGAVGDASDGLIFFEIGFRADTPSTNDFKETSRNLSGALTAAIPARDGLSVRLRSPFYVVPFDLILLSPMYLFSQKAYTAMAVTASNGGLIPWQEGMATRAGRFQFVLGRELGVTWFGSNEEAQLVVASDPPGGVPRLVNFKSVNFDLPILEYRPYRGFSDRQSSTLLFQLFAAADRPRDVKVESPPGAATPDLHTVWSAGIRMTFDWRRYW